MGVTESPNGMEKIGPRSRVAAATVGFGTPAAAASTAAMGLVACGPVAGSIVASREASYASGAASTAAAATAPGVIRVCAGPLRTNGNRSALDLLASSILLGMLSVVAGEVLASPISLHSSILLG